MSFSSVDKFFCLSLSNLAFLLYVIIVSHVFENEHLLTFPSAFLDLLPTTMAQFASLITSKLLMSLEKKVHVTMGIVYLMPFLLLHHLLFN